MKESTRLEAEKNITDIKDRIDFFCKEISNFSLVTKQNEEKHKVRLEELKMELRDVAGILKKKNENKQNFEQNLKNEEILERTKRMDLERLRKEIGKMKEENLRKKFCVNHGKQELSELMGHIRKTQTSVIFLNFSLIYFYYFKYKQSYLDLTEVFDISKEDLQRTFTNIEFTTKNDHSMLENYDLDVPNLLKKTISFQKRTYTSHSLLKNKFNVNSRNESQGVEIENEERTGVDGEVKPQNPNGDCFGNKCKIF